MSEHEPYDEAMVEHFCTPSPAEYERSEYAYRLALMARSEHALRLEAEARVEELEVTPHCPYDDVVENGGTRAHALFAVSHYKFCPHCGAALETGENDE